jgi:hypothetical protein
MNDQRATFRWTSRVARFAGAVLVAIGPFALTHSVSNISGVEFLGTFAACGVLGGLVGGFSAIPGAIAAYLNATTYLARTEGLGSGGDGDLYYIAAVAGSGCYCVAAGLAEVLRRLGFLPSLWPSQKVLDD